MIAGTAFALTACAYGVMMVKMLDPTKAAGDETNQFFVNFMDQHGVTIMLVELGLLAVCTVAAIGTDGFWSRESKSRGDSQQGDSPAAASPASERKPAAEEAAT